MESLHATLEFARANAHERDAVAVIFVHVRLDFEHEAAEIVALRVDLLAGKRVGIRQRTRRPGARNSFRKGSTPKFVSAEPKNTGESLPQRTAP